MLSMNFENGLLSITVCRLANGMALLVVIVVFSPPDKHIYINRVEMVENIHMKQRMMGVTFAIKTREAKDRYLDSQFKNALAELLSDAANLGPAIAMRRLVTAQIALQVAQNLGIDYHAATEELYYYMRKNDEQTHEQVMQLVASLLERGAKK